MIKKINSILLAGLLALAAASPTWAADKLPDTLTVAGQQLSKIGDGTRKKLFLKLYKAAYYGKDSNYTSDQPMLIRLVITSGFVTSEKLNSATTDGFNKVTNDNTAAIAPEIKQLLDALSAPVNEDDTLDFAYSDQAIVVSQNGKALTTIKGKAFKDIFFSIWLGKDSIDDNLREDMLDL
ncbi:chalcone isomerase-like protein [Sinobacterium caligoides]|uniref:Chalcone isomerase-like protein n=1 Tax=Sinobacterium caligoides TaxID=933926 RepID=A0A3N2DH18_9GAMM|nr:chalcone isomerase family protein [Sinobacterium caligoides]ROR99083.1 chalcone isomerase-like protein [Sinobacterium caligoides]